MSAPDQYPEDEFDLAARRRTAQGSHRERPRRGSLLPLIAVLAALVVVVWVAAVLVGGGDDETATGTDGSAITPTEGPAESPTGAGSPTEGPADGPTEDGPAGVVDRNADVSVLNGAGVAGIAGRTADTLAGAGWTSVDVGNFGAGPPEATTVFYADPAMEASAEAVAEDLGIDLVEMDPELVGTGTIVVLLRPDFQE